MMYDPRPSEYTSTSVRELETLGRDTSRDFGLLHVLPFPLPVQMHSELSLPPVVREKVVSELSSQPQPVYHTQRDFSPHFCTLQTKWNKSRWQLEDNACVRDGRKRDSIESQHQSLAIIERHQKLAKQLLYTKVEVLQLGLGSATTRLMPLMFMAGHLVLTSRFKRHCVMI